MPHIVSGSRALGGGVSSRVLAIRPLGFPILAAAGVTVVAIIKVGVSALSPRARCGIGLRSSKSLVTPLSWQKRLSGNKWERFTRSDWEPVSWHEHARADHLCAYRAICLLLRPWPMRIILGVSAQIIASSAVGAMEYFYFHPHVADDGWRVVCGEDRTA